MNRPSVISCAVFGGVSPKTGRRVGERHRWSGGAWGKGTCVFCGRDLERVQEKPEVQPARSAHAAVALDEQNSRRNDWRPSYDSGAYGNDAGWYITRLLNGMHREWMREPSGRLLRRATKKQALAVISALHEDAQCPSS